jgi:hypothetical protein
MRRKGRGNVVFNPFKKDGYTGRTPLRFCPVCFCKLDAFTNLTGMDLPVPGDFTICIKCRSILRFRENLELEKSSLMEVPVQIRFQFAKVLRVMDEMPPLKKKEGE